MLTNNRQETAVETNSKTSFNCHKMGKMTGAALKATEEQLEADFSVRFVPRLQILIETKN
jgi:hypothetical protein